MKDKLRVIIGGVILLPHIVTFLCLKMNSGGGQVDDRFTSLETDKGLGAEERCLCLAASLDDLSRAA